jgi:hypothetical protein
MSSAKAFSWKDLSRMLPGLLVSLLALAAVFYFADLEAVGEALRLVDYRALVLVVALFLGTMMALGVAWRTILQEKVTWRKAFLTLNEGYLLNNVLPFRLGEFGRAFLLRSTANLSFWEVLSTIVVERVFDVALMTALLLGSLPFVIGLDWARQAAIGAGIIVVVGFAALFVLARNRQWTLNTFARLTARWPKLADFGKEKLNFFLDGLATLGSAGRFGKVLVWMLVTWAFNVSWYFVLLRAFFPQADILWALFLVGVSSLGVAVPSSPAYVGVLEAAIVGALSLFSIDASSALAYALMAHGIYFVITVAIGAFALAQDGASLVDLYRQIRTQAA